MLTLGEFRKKTFDKPDNTEIRIVTQQDADNTYHNEVSNCELVTDETGECYVLQSDYMD